MYAITTNSITDRDNDTLTVMDEGVYGLRLTITDIDGNQCAVNVSREDLARLVVAA